MYSRNPIGVGIFAIAVSLRRMHAAEERIVGALEELLIHDVVRIKNQIPIVVLRGRQQPLKREKQHIAFGTDGHIRADYTRSRALRRTRGIVGAIVGKHINVIQAIWVALRLQAGNAFANHAFFIAGSDQNRQLFAGTCAGDHPPLAQAAQNSNDHIIRAIRKSYR